jgi:hypothetical protein
MGVGGWEWLGVARRRSSGLRDELRRGLAEARWIYAREGGGVGSWGIDESPPEGGPYFSSFSMSSIT